MNDATLPGNIREYVVYSAYYVVSAIRCDANNIVTQVPYTDQIYSNLILIFVISETIEDGSLDGGFGERIARFYGPSDMKVINFGVKKQLYDRYDVNELLRENHLTEEQIVADIKAIL